MAERFELLDAAIQAILDGAAEVMIPRDLEPLVAIAADLRDLPDPEFRKRLGGRMTTTLPATHINDVIPYLVAEDVNGLIDFVKDVFGAEEIFRTQAPAGTHCEVRLGGRRFMIGGGAPGRSNRGAIHLFVDDVDATYARTIATGATSLHPPVDQPYGQREASIEDRFGNHWYIATEKGKGADMVPFFHPIGAANFIDFLVNALGAQVKEREERAGTIVYAQVQLGRTAVELGEAHGGWQPLPMMLMVTVDDADAAYAHALGAGATSLHQPMDAPYGRVGAVEDGFGNQWFLTAEK